MGYYNAFCPLLMVRQLYSLADRHKWAIAVGALGVYAASVSGSVEHMSKLVARISAGKIKG